MSDRIPGTTYDNPVWFGKWRIYLDGCNPFGGYAYCHDDYDGAEDARDNRYGNARTVEACKNEIAELEADTDQGSPVAKSPSNEEGMVS